MGAKDVVRGREGVKAVGGGQFSGANTQRGVACGGGGLDARERRSTFAVVRLLHPPMFEQAFKNIDDVLWKDAGCTSELDYTEQSSWLLFLKYLDTLEVDKATEAALDGNPPERGIYAASS